MEELVAPTPTVPADSSPTAASEITVPPPTLSHREQIRIEFYKTYDVMTGVRIAATLGGFFGLMVLLVVYKSKCKSRSLSDEHLEAAVAAAVIEEEEELALNALNLYGPRRSLGNMSAPAPIGTYPRFSSLGGCSLLNPPMRLCYGQRARVSLPVVEPPTKFTPSPVPKNRLTLVSSSPADNTYDEEEEEDDDYPAHFLQVPSRRTSRRLSSITCSSSDTSYLERRGSAVEMGLPAAPPMHRHYLPHEAWDFYYPIDIQVIQPTPILSPCGSEGTLYDRPVTVPSASPVASTSGAAPARAASGLSVPKMAPLASISSCAVSASSDADGKSIASDCRSIGSDSVFLDEDCFDTEDEAEEFSTDSDNNNNNNDDGDLCATPSVPFAEHLQICRYPRTLAGRWHNVSGAVCRRYSSPSSHKVSPPRNPVSASASADDEQFPSCSKSCGAFIDSKVYLRPPIPLPHSDDSDGDDTLSDSDTINNDQQQQDDDDDDDEPKQQQTSDREATQPDDKTLEAMSPSSPETSVFTKKEEEETEIEGTLQVKAPTIGLGHSEFSELSLQPITSASCDHLVKALTEKSKILSSSMKDIVEHCSSWSQETLF